MQPKPWPHSGIYMEFLCGFAVSVNLTKVAVGSEFRPLKFGARSKVPAFPGICATAGRVPPKATAVHIVTERQAFCFEE
jgi:hypothetical protein